jgi:prepilin signal peptidase PulO-like enzyme (type II secretory pathway)
MPSTSCFARLERRPGRKLARQKRDSKSKMDQISLGYEVRIISSDFLPLRRSANVASMVGVAEILPLSIGAIALGGHLYWDARRLILPDWLNAVLAGAGIAFHIFSEWHFLSHLDLFLGAALGAGLLFALRWLFLRLRGVEALGLGDVKLMAAAGCWVGLTGLPLILLVGSLGTLITIFALRAGGLGFTGPLAARRIPFGPGLCAGLVVAVARMLLAA